MTGVSVRIARRSDAHGIAILWTELMQHHSVLDARFSVTPEARLTYEYHAQTLMRSRDGRVLVAETAGDTELVGYLIGEIQEQPALLAAGRYGFLRDIYVREAWRRHGIGRMMVDDLRRWLVSRKANAMELYVATENPAAIDFWKSLGLSAFLLLMHQDL